MKIRIKKLHEDAVIPKYAMPGDAGFDFYALEDVTIAVGETKLVRTGLAFDVGYGYELQVRPRSGLSLKTSLRVANSPGTVDSSFRGEVCAIMHLAANSYGTISYTIKKGDRIAQGVVCPVVQADIEVVDYLSETERSTGGFGSTGL